MAPDEVVKVKSMTTAETGLNAALAGAGVDVAETDLAELIVQLGDDLPSHIVVPAIHRNRSEVREIFVEHMGEHGLAAPAGLTDEPAALAAAARAHLRARFLRADGRHIGRQLRHCGQRLARGRRVGRQRADVPHAARRR